MKNLIRIALFLSATAVFAQPTAKDLDKLTWLQGNWNRTNAKPGRSGVEMWWKTSATEWNGKGINLRGADTTFVEKLKIIVKDNKVYYVADVPQNKTVVLFEFTSLTNTGFVCENRQHDFPKKIAYELTGNILKATISGDEKAIDYLFERE